VHHAPENPPLSVRVAGFLATLLRVLRRTRVLPVALTALALGAFAVAAPLAPYDDDARSTAAVSADTDSGLVPVAGGGWTQDGVPAPSSPADEGSTSRSSSGRSSSAPLADPAPGSITDPPAASSADTSAAGTSSTAGNSSTADNSSSSPSSSSSSPSPSAASDESPTPVETPSGTPSQTPEDEAPAEHPAAAVLDVVNTARAAAGCAALTRDADLAALAAEHSAAMRDGGFVDVESPGGGAPLDQGGRTAVVARGADSAAVAAGWAADPALLDCGLTTAGVGTTAGYWTLVAA
jgi:uncharacterized protein YkwD